MWNEINIFVSSSWVGNKSILETIVESFSGYGYTNIVMCLNYKSHVIKDYFCNGSDFGDTTADCAMHGYGGGNSTRGV